MSEMIEHAVALGVGVGQISDAMDELGLPQNAGGGYRLLGGKGGTAYGRAFTLKQIMVGPGGEAIVRHGEAALSLASPGDILVIDAGENTDIVTWGEGHTLRARSNRLNGVVIHGATRDAEALGMSELPVLCRGTSPVRSKGRFHTAAIGQPVQLGSVRISQGDLVAISMDGLVCIPAGHEGDVLKKAWEIQLIEMKRDEALRMTIGNLKDDIV